jgi:hypothetical protein
MENIKAKGHVIEVGLLSNARGQNEYKIWNQ